MKTLSFGRQSPTWQAQASHQPVSFTQRLNQLWQSFVRFMTESSNQPHIWISHDQNGQVQWNAVDPLTGRRLTQVTKEEVLVWLENRYYAQ